MSEPSVATEYGRIRGYRYGKVYSFFGVEYAKAERFKMPRAPEPWDDLRDATNFGYVAPLLNYGVGADSMRRRFWPESEECLTLNIWTTSIENGANKPVLVWFHGGGYATGSTLNHECYDGYQLSEFGDVCVVTVNHRLNILGFLDVSDFGGEFHNSGNAGIADLVESLRWIRNNIAAFGGDPGNVTICGQSGGGGKVTAIMQTAEADGLYHKAFIESGVLEKSFFNKKEYCKLLADKMIEKLGGKNGDISALIGVSWEMLRNICNQSLPEVQKEIGRRFIWAPIPNDWYRGNPLEVGFSEYAKKVPVVVGTTFGEFKNAVRISGRASMPEETAMTMLLKRYGADAEKIVRMFRKAYPELNIAYIMNLDVNAFRNETLNYLEARAAQCTAPTYSYMFALTYPIDDDRPAWHSGDMPFLFHNYDTNPVCSIPGVSERVQDQFAGAWVNLGRNGDPSNSALPEVWRPYTLDDRATMIIGKQSRLAVDFDRALIRFLFENCPDPSLTEMPKKEVRDHNGRSLTGI